MKSLSKAVTSNQTGAHKDLISILQRMSGDNYQRPISDFSYKTLSAILSWLSLFDDQRDIILDLGCGVGESSFHLALNYSDKLIIGIDKSISRLERKSSFKLDNPENLLIVRGELLDLWYLFATNINFPKERVFKQYILYPNPWPKSKHIRRRWHANPVAPFLFSINSEIELRSNWKIYTSEFQKAADYFGHETEQIILKVDNPISLFEKKYLESGHELFQVIAKKRLLHKGPID